MNMKQSESVRIPPIFAKGSSLVLKVSKLFHNYNNNIQRKKLIFEK